MMNDAAAQTSSPRYGPVTFLAALANILIVELAIWIALPWFVFLIYAVPLLAIDLIVAAVLKSRPGLPGQVGRGMLIGLTAAPAALAVFLPGFMLAQGLGFL